MSKPRPVSKNNWASPSCMQYASLAGYIAILTQFQSTLLQFKNAEQHNIEGTDIKLNANNAIYSKLRSMFYDGQLIFHTRGAIRERFIFSKVYSLVSLSLPSPQSVSVFSATTTDGELLD